jgi:hypothetical protein
MKKIDVLGTEYTLEERTETEDEVLKQYEGYCDSSIMTCVIKKYPKDGKDIMDKNDPGVHARKIKRHELIHAFLFESGLAENSEWAMTEEMVDWFAMQFPKLLKAFQTANCI